MAKVLKGCPQSSGKEHGGGPEIGPNWRWKER